MKYLLVLAVVMVAFWLWRNGRRQEQAEAAQRASARPARRPSAGTPQEMARCATCGLHLPQSDALPGPGGWYCSAEHQAQARP